MSYRTLRECVDDLQKSNQLIRIEQTVDPYLEASAIVRRVFAAGGPAVYFASVKGCKFPMVANLFGTSKRLEYIFRDTAPVVERLVKMGLDPLAIVRNLFSYANPSAIFAAYHAKPKYVGSGEVTKNSTSISDLPQLVGWQKDGGAYITLPCVYSEDPDSPGLLHSNLGFYRIQISGGQYQQGGQVGMHYHLHRGIGIHHLKAIRRKEKLPVNVFIGGAPSMAIAAMAPLPEGVSELSLAGMLSGRRIPMIRQKEGPAIYADADFCLKGYIEPKVMLPEGPFGDRLGMYTEAGQFPVMRVECVYHRPRPIWPFTVVGRPPQENVVLRKFIRELIGPSVAQMIPGVKAVHPVDEAGGEPLLLAIGRESFMPYYGERQPMELLTLANAILGANQLSAAKYLLIAAQEDDPTLTVDDVREFLRHMLERIDLRRDLHFQTRASFDKTDFGSVGGLNNGSKLVIAAAGKPIRKLPMGIATGMNLHEGLGFTNPRVFLPGILLIDGPAYQKDATGKDNSIERFCQSFQRNEPINQYPLIVVVDKGSTAGANLKNFLWATFTKTDPANDVYGIESFTSGKRWGCNGSLVIDARNKPYYAEPLEESPDVTKAVEALAVKGGPLWGII